MILILLINEVHKLDANLKKFDIKRVNFSSNHTYELYVYIISQIIKLGGIGL